MDSQIQIRGWLQRLPVIKLSLPPGRPARAELQIRLLLHYRLVAGDRSDVNFKRVSLLCIPYARRLSVRPRRQQWKLSVDQLPGSSTISNLYVREDWITSCMLSTDIIQTGLKQRSKRLQQSRLLAEMHCRIVFLCIYASSLYTHMYVRIIMS